MNAPLGTTRLAVANFLNDTRRSCSSMVRTLASALLTLLAVGAGSAQAADLAQSYEAAVTNDPVLGAARAQLAATEEAIPQTRSLLLPRVGMNGSTTWNEIDIVSADTPELQYNDHQWGAQLAQPIINMESWLQTNTDKFP